MMTEEAAAARRAYKRQWARNNPDKVQAQQERYWQRRAQAEQAPAQGVEAQTAPAGAAQQVEGQPAPTDNAQQVEGQRHGLRTVEHRH